MIDIVKSKETPEGKLYCGIRFPTLEQLGFRTEDMYTIAQHIGHAAETITWFFEGAFGGKGFDMNFDNYEEKMKKYISYNECVEQFKTALDNAIRKIESFTKGVHYE